MNENIRSVVFVVVAVSMLGLAWATQPRPAADPIAALTGQAFFPEFTDPFTAKELEIVDFDEATATILPFEVKQVNGIWSLPSHENYPADANRQMAEAAAALVDVKRLSVMGDDPSSHEEYGVVEPDPKKLSGGATGVGKKVTLKDASGNSLAQFIIGKEVKDQPSLRYVRVPGQDRVYTAEIKTDKLSTRFEDWIEKDLLKLNAFDVRKVVVDDHSIDELNRSLIPRSKISLSFDSKDSKWKLDNMQVFKGRRYEPDVLADDEELNATKLNEMKTALDDLKIVDVRHKPKGLSGDLRAEASFLENAESVQSLRSRGFWVAEIGDRVELFSNDGEIRCGMNDGVEYVLRFGGIAGPSGSAKQDGEGNEAGDAEQPAADEAGGANRYILVTAQFNQDLIPKPELTPLPGEAAAPAPAKKAPATEDDADEANPENDATDDADADGDAEAGDAEADDADAEGDADADAGDEDADADADQDAEADDDSALDDAGAARAAEEPGAAQDRPQPVATDEPADDEAADEENVDDQPADEDGSDDADEPDAEDSAEDAPADDEPDADAGDEDQPATEKPAAEKPKADKPAEDKPAAPKKTPAEIKAERDRIEKDNKRKQDDYEAKVKKGEERVKELSDRFADWYYIISDKTYQKIHLGRDEIVKKKDPPAGEKDKAGAAMEPGDELNLDEQEGLPD